MSAGEDVAEVLLKGLERFKDEQGLDRLMTAQLRLLVAEAMKGGGMDESMVRARLPRVYQEHAPGLVRVISRHLPGHGVELEPRGDQTGGTAGLFSQSTHASTLGPGPADPGLIGEAPSATAVRESVFLPTRDVKTPPFGRTDRRLQFQPLATMEVIADDGGFLLEWRPLGAGPVVYRVTRSANRQDVPEWGEDTAVVKGPRVVDAVLPDWPVVHYQVWAYALPDGTDDLDGVQPELQAESMVVIPPRGVVITSDLGRVVGTWRHHSYADRIHVYRKPLAGASGRPTDPQFRIHVGMDNVAGFVDTEVRGGQRYLYSVAAEVIDGGVGEMSPYVETVVDVPLRVEPVRDLEVLERTNDRGQAVLDLQWTPPSPGAEVRIYVNDTPPADGIDREAQPIARLGKWRLGEQLNYPVRDHVDQKKRISDVLWQDGWARMHFTAVSVQGDQVFASRTITKVASQIRIHEAALHQRVSHQVITLAWPLENAEGMATRESYSFQNVHLFQMPPGADVRTRVRGKPFATISAAAYRQDGGLRVSLGSERCDVALVPVSLQGGENFLGQPFVLHYQGLKILHYRLTKEGLRLPWAKKVGLALKLRSSVAEPKVPPLVLIHNAERLPLDRADGTEVHMVVKGDTGEVARRFIEPGEVGPTWTDMTWTCEVPAAGFVRLFVNLPLPESATWAILDPLVQALRVK